MYYCSTLLRNTMVSDFSYPEIHFSRKWQKGEGMGSSDKNILGYCLIAGSAKRYLFGIMNC